MPECPNTPRKCICRVCCSHYLVMPGLLQYLLLPGWYCSPIAVARSSTGGFPYKGNATVFSFRTISEILVIFTAGADL